MPSVLSAVWSCWRPGRNVPSHSVRPRSSQIFVNFDRVHFLLAGHERPPPWPVCRWVAHLDLAAVDPQLDPVGGGVGEHIGQRGKPHPSRGGVSPPSQQRADLGHGPGHRRAVHPVHHRQRGVRDLQPQHREGDQHPVGEHQLMARASALRAATVVFCV
jgi:hypothetical protein